MNDHPCLHRKVKFESKLLPTALFSFQMQLQLDSNVNILNFYLTDDSRAAQIIKEDILNKIRSANTDCNILVYYNFFVLSLERKKVEVNIFLRLKNSQV